MIKTMKRHFKKYFIPHEDNDHEPHFLRPKSVLFIVGLILAAEALFFMDRVLILKTNLSALIFPDALVAQTNDSRVGLDDLAPLQISRILTEAAQMKANDMAAKSYFAHTSPEGVTPWHWFDEAGYKYAYAGENLAVNFSDSSDVTEAWLNSPTHRANILNNKFSEIGIATAKGIYKERETVFVVQMFGRPVKTALAATEPTETAPIESEQALPEAEELAVAVEEPPIAREPELLGEEMSAVYPEEMFIAINGGGAEIVAEAAPRQPAIASFGSEAIVLAKKAVSSPRRGTNTLILFLASIMAAALILKIFIKIRIQKPRLIMNGLLVLALAVMVMAANSYFTLTFAEVL